MRGRDLKEIIIKFSGIALLGEFIVLGLLAYQYASGREQFVLYILTSAIVFNSMVWGAKLYSQAIMKEFENLENDLNAAIEGMEVQLDV